MKKLLFLGLLLPLMAWSQNDFETRYFTIDAESLPEIPEVAFIPKKQQLENTGTLTLEKTPTFNSVLDAYKISTDNYWQPVDMTVALGGSTVNYSDPSLRLKKLQEKQFGFTITGNGGRSSFEFSDGQTTVRNNVYQEQRPFYIHQNNQPRYYRNPFYFQEVTPIRN
ncbi:hypothetical protein ULMS_27630 [Patiriisocius marinistellae]|uniref:Uncharacterized protein n=1 Tax=Patiriisocius marinistellae TaxID=2494560 RepID=A0A5J4G3B5_9FLAO|nr:hypothetical protein [Patiriisocius marinistellae]GEQ87255.1 hypothetical protein ULMS_27630 [Patiriisocius marinistellae]